MQLKGLVQFFTIILILFAVYQLSITFVVRNVEKSMQAQAEREIKAKYPGANADSTRRLVETRYEAINDSMLGVEIFNIGIKKYTLQSAKDEELKLGLDLQGGMNVTLEVGLDEMVLALSNSPKDMRLKKALEAANAKREKSDVNFIVLFGESFEEQNAGVKLAPLFVKPGTKNITLASTNKEVINAIREAAADAIKNTYSVLQKRIDKFGVSSNSVSLDEAKGIINVELAGVHNPDRVRGYLQATAKLQFFETYTNEEFAGSLQAADLALSHYLAGDVDTAASDSTHSTDSTKTANGTDTLKAKPGSITPDTGSHSLSGMVKGGSKKGADSNQAKIDEARAKNPLFFVLNPFTDENNRFVPGAVIGIVQKKDTAKLHEYLNIDVVKARLPANVKILYAADQDRKSNFLYAYAVKVPPGGNAKIEGEHVTDARTSLNQLNGKPNVLMSMDNSGQQLWRDMTAHNVRKFIAIVLDDKVYSCPKVEGAINSVETEIQGNFTPEQATDLANILKTGKLPAPAHIVAEQVVGPTLGKENIDKGMNSLMLSFIIIFALMLVYYNSGGIVADISLILNLLFTVGILSISLLGATLTMAGIAGLVLTVGMAVDTNVIIFERIKEELTAGKSYLDAVSEGYKRSYAPVLDGHVTTLITAIILFNCGLGPIKGFATTQIIGILLSLFCGILVSRLITDMYTKRGRHFNYFTGLSKSIFKKAHFKFVEARKYTYIISVIVLLAGISTYWVGFDKGVEFSGGRSFKIKFDKPITIEDARTKLKPYFGEFPTVKTIGNNNQLDITTSFMIENRSQSADMQVEEKLHEGLNKENMLPAGVTFDVFKTRYLLSSNKVSAVISKELKQGAINATVLSLLAIFLYILFRFRKWQYSLGTILSLLHDICVTLAVFSFFRGKVPFALEIDQHFIAAVLTVVGFSMNDTVIVFDRIREYFRHTPGEDKVSVINRAINDTLSRTIMTSLTVFITLIILFVVGGEATRGFAFAMLIGVFTGTYSSIFVAAPVLVDMDKSGALNVEINHAQRIEDLKSQA